MNKIKYSDVKKILNGISNIKTGDIDKISKMLIKNKTDVSDLRDYVLKDSLQPYYTENLKKDIYVKRLKRKVLLDPRIKSGIEH